MPYVRSGAATVHFVTSDIPGPTLVLTHGFLMDESMFEPMREPLAVAGINLVTIDARCHGRTQSPDGEPFTYWDMAADTLSVMDELGIEKAVIGGMSQGGYTALRLALLAPERVRGLALIDTDAGACTADEFDFYRTFFDRWCSAEPMAPLVAELAPLLVGGNDPRLWRAWTSRWYSSDRQSIMPAVRCLLERRSLLHRLPEIGAPTLVIRGSQDGSSSAHKNAAMAAGLVNADGVVTIPGAGQGAAWTHPEVLAPLLIRLVRRAAARPANPLTHVLAHPWPQERAAAEIHIAR
ncbi:alpha/beta fold hydrolase [Nocardia sp. SYP-A9097]|uniref:alpha/beta fold hydrolase n=1 Tax=Nocardia sp. SYP-A9097 TaxID=2663237 RepID=UPI00129AD7D4|nr:alpha/beta hydrolase [Nocardia sp. SYP-A9097]MRH87859.1 alpha/beta fold hydrolase [Nocardia sp. SYP-A9097]